jgi:hypothetical protein
MTRLQSVFILLVMLLLAYLVIDGWTRRRVWVKGARNGLFSFRNWAHSCERDEDAWSYWFAMGFYTLALICLGGLLLFA